MVRDTNAENIPDPSSFGSRLDCVMPGIQVTDFFYGLIILTSCTQASAFLQVPIGIMFVYQNTMHFTLLEALQSV